MLKLEGFEPVEFGLPEAEYPSFRAAQLQALEWAAESNKRVLAACLPPGSGKTLIAMALAKILGVRAIVLTATKGLQEQYLRSFAASGLVEIKGKDNYQCRGKADTTCRWGELEGCPHAATPECTYERKRFVAKESDLVVTNYAYWIRVNELARGLELTPEWGGPNPPGLLVLDEAHLAVEQVSSALRVVLRESVLLGLKLAPPKTENMMEWIGWAYSTDGQELINEFAAAYSKKRTLVSREKLYQAEQTAQALVKISRMNAESFVCSMRLGTPFGRVWEFDCVWPGAYTESKLLLGVPKVFMMSATLQPITLSHLGIGREQYEFREWGRVFPGQNTPVYWVKTAQLKHNMTDADRGKWLMRIEEIIASRLSSGKGIIHTGSYLRQEYLLRHSVHAKYMIANTQEPDTPGAVEAAQKFKEATAPAILVSPSFSTGWDFPDEECRWQIIAKVPFPDTRGKLMQARLEHDPRYANNLAMQELVQAAGRGTRHAKDWCEVFVIDDNVDWFLRRCKGIKPGWFNVIPCGEKVPAPWKSIQS